MRPGGKKHARDCRKIEQPTKKGGRTKHPRSRKHRHHRKQCRMPEPYDSDSNYDYCDYYGGDYDDNLD